VSEVHVAGSRDVAVAAPIGMVRWHPIRGPNRSGWRRGGINLSYSVVATAERSGTRPVRSALAAAPRNRNGWT